jgi:LuxR family maltose regulon positive regulatory protein
MSLRDVKDRSRAVAHFDGSDRPVAEYLTHEVLDRQPRHVVHFLLETSVLDRLDADICKVVTGRDDAAAVLHEIERRALFITPSDEPPGSYRYDPLFRELLEGTLRRTDPARHRAVRFRAAVWFEGRGNPAAFEHWLEAGEVDRAWELFHAHAVSRVFAGGRSTVARWTMLLPDRTPAIDAGRAVDLALALMYLGDTRSAESWMEHAIGVLARSGGVPAETDARLAYARFLFDFARGEYHDARVHGDRARDLLGGHQSPNRWGQLRGSLVYVRVASILGDFDAADAMYAQATREISPRGPVDRVVLPTAACELELRKGNLRRAEELAERALEAAAAIADRLDPITADAYFVAGAARLERNDVSGAEWRLRTAMQLGERSGFIHSWVCPALSLARVWHLLGRGGDAWKLLGEVRQHRGHAVPHVLAQRIEATSARLALLEGDVERARAHAALSDEPRRLRLMARIHAEAGEPELALSANEHVVARGRRDRVDGLLVLARCAPADALRARALHEALRTAERDGFMRVFLDEARWITEPLRELVATWPTPYVADLVTALANEPSRSPRATGALTEREVEVWRYLSTPLSTREVADALFISRNTLKSHLRSIYRKLGVTTRSEAVARGEEQLGRQAPRRHRQSPRVG